MSIELQYASSTKVVQTFEEASPDDATATFDTKDTSATLTSSTTPPVTKHAIFDQAMTAGAATIDLTALPQDEGTVDGTGLKVQAMKFINPVGNAAITVTEGASNGYELLGSAFSFILLAGQEVTVYGNDATPDIAAGAKEIDISGTTTQELEVHVVMG